MGSEVGIRSQESVIFIEHKKKISSMNITGCNSEQNPSGAIPGKEQYCTRCAWLIIEEDEKMIFNCPHLLARGLLKGVRRGVACELAHLCDSYPVVLAACSTQVLFNFRNRIFQLHCCKFLSFSGHWPKENEN